MVDENSDEEENALQVDKVGDGQIEKEDVCAIFVELGIDYDDEHDEQTADRANEPDHRV